MTKVLLVISKYLPEYTGAAYRIDGLYRRLKSLDENLEIEVLCNSTSEQKSQNYIHDGVKVRRVVFPFKLSFLPKRLRDSLKTYYEAFGSYIYMRKKRPDIIHIVGDSGATRAALIYGRVKKIPRIIELVTCRATPLQYLPLLRYPEFLKLKQQCAVITISAKLADDCKGIGLTGNVWSRPNPIDGGEFFPEFDKKHEYRARLSPFSDDDIVISMVAKFMPQKNQIFMIDVLKHLPENYKLLLAGPKAESGIFKERDQKYFEDIKALINKYGLESRVHIVADFVKAGDYMKAADIYVMPQRSEGLGTPMLEAFACALPVVANANEPAFCQWVENGKNGFLCDMQPEIWGDNIVKALEIPQAKLLENSENIRNIADIDKCDKEYKKLINELISLPLDKELKVSDVF